jgi:hypothetical protein
VEGLAKNIGQPARLLQYNPNSYDSNFDKFQVGNTFQMSDNNFFGAIQANQRPNLEYMSNLNDSLAMSRNETISHTVNIKSSDGNDMSSKENIPEFMVYMQKNNGNPVSLTQQFVKMADSTQNKPGTQNPNEPNGQLNTRTILGEQRINTNVVSSNGKGSLGQKEHSIDPLRKQLHHEYRIDTQNTNYDMSDGESIHETHSDGTRHRKKPNLLIKLEERRTTIGSNYAYNN